MVRIQGTGAAAFAVLGCLPFRLWYSAPTSRVGWLRAPPAQQMYSMQLEATTSEVVLGYKCRNCLFTDPAGVGVVEHGNTVAK